MLAVMPTVVAPCLVGGYWLPPLLSRWPRKELLIDWVDHKHGKHTAVVRKSDHKRGVATTGADINGQVKVRFDGAASGSEPDTIKVEDVLVVEAGSLRCVWPSCRSRHVAVRQDSEGAGSAKIKGSYWTKACRGEQSYYYRWRLGLQERWENEATTELERLKTRQQGGKWRRWETLGLKFKESTLTLPKEIVLRTEEPGLTAFEEGLGEAEQMDALRSAGRLNVESPWTKAVRGDRAYYWRSIPSKRVGGNSDSESTLVLPAEGVQTVQMGVQKSAFKEGLAQAGRMDELRSAGQLNFESRWTKVIHSERAYYARGGIWDASHRMWYSDSHYDGVPPEELSLDIPPEGVHAARVSSAGDFGRHYTTVQEKY